MNWMYVVAGVIVIVVVIVGVVIGCEPTQKLSLDDSGDKTP